MATKLNYGIDTEIQARISARWNQADANEALKWIGDLAGTKLEGDFQAALKDGVALCKAMNAIVPNSCKINMMKMPFMQRENIVSFLEACKKYGLKETDVFVTQDLFEGDNLVSVCDCIFSLGGLAKTKGFRGPTIGVKQAQSQGPSKFTVTAAGGATPSRQTQGSYGYADTTVNRSLAHQIVKSTDSGLGANQPGLLSTGSIAQNPNSDKLDKIIRNVDETRAQSGAGAAAHGHGASPFRK